MARPAIAQIAYDGEALRAGSMDVRDLAPALLAIGDLLQSANHVLNGDRANLSVKVRSDFETGSFEIYLELVQSLAAQAHMFITGEQLKTAKEIAELVGLVIGGGGGIIGALKLLKLLKGEKPKDATTLQNGNVQVTITGSNNHVEVKPEVLQLANDTNVQKAASEVMRPLASEGVEEFQVRSGKQTIERYSRDDLPSFSQPPLLEHEVKGVDEERVVAYEVIKPSFEDSLTWMFSDGSGGRVNAIMKDEGFLRRLTRREIHFTKGDILKLKLRSRSYVSGDGLRTEHEVVHVLEIIDQAKNLPLLPSVEVDPKLLPPASPRRPRKRR